MLSSESNFKAGEEWLGRVDDHSCWGSFSFRLVLVCAVDHRLPAGCLKTYPGE